ncbi:MAG: PqqD family peptide modification chaperone [Alphaproteobacteria bacterium]
MHASSLYRAEGLDPLVAIADDGRLMATLGEVMLGWNIVPAGDDLPAGEAAIRIEQGARGWTCSGETYDKPVTYADPVATACSLIAGLYKAHTLTDREGLFLHAAGVRIGAGLVLLTGHYRAGKSVVTTACAAAGLQVFSDDIIPLDPGGRVARAPGLAIRLRLPLPDGMAPGTRDFVATHRIASSERYAYIRPPPDCLAERGEAAPIRAVVSLHRTEGAPVRLSRLAPGDALSETIRRNFARETPAGRILDAFDGLVAEVPCLRLSYDRAEDAAALLRDAFEGALPNLDAELPAHPSSGKKRRPAKLIADGTVIHRRPGADARERGDQAFLTDAEEEVIFHLNATGTALWRLLEQPTPFGELAAIFAAGFPDRDAGALASDLSRLIRDLAASGLVRIEPR